MSQPPKKSTAPKESRVSETGLKIPWAEVRHEYVMLRHPPHKIAEKYGINEQHLLAVIRKRRWGNKRREQLKVERALEAGREIDDPVFARLDALKLITRTKRLIWQQLMRRIADDSYQGTVADLVTLSKIEMDLEQPGWDKPAEISSDGGMSAAQIVLMAEEARQRRIGTRDAEFEVVSEGEITDASDSRDGAESGDDPGGPSAVHRVDADDP